MTTQRDYSLLRPFDTEAAKRGEAMIWFVSQTMNNDMPRTYVAGPDELGTVCITVNNGLLDLIHSSKLRMAPLCWVEGRPVYINDTLYHRETGKKRTVTGGNDEYLVVAYSEVFLHPSCFTWAPPTIKREGWINLYSKPDWMGEHQAAFSSHVWATEKDALERKDTHDGFLKCIPVEWEEAI